MNISALPGLAQTRGVGEVKATAETRPAKKESETVEPIVKREEEADVKDERKSLREILETTLNSAVQLPDYPNARFAVDFHKESNNFVYLLVNNEDGEVIKQFPSEEALKRIAYFRGLSGLSVDKQV
ncbi:flagellar protein FlaG [Oceanibacterium hippocampi]|uniref:Flagellar protein FlaG n=1 Tax=Oceanibacterium hippocampi TaxID=745714 RepID=A0A1Y5U249_9PROT|nr:flagellar protein FlaG [Oceanibacterium hippocampi]SLN77145.1 flagellar protein FlaG [Oceanibacterium hippocampi]